MLMWMLQVLRDQHAMADALQNRRLGHPLGQTLLGKTALLVGFGNIAVELVPRCATGSHGHWESAHRDCVSGYWL